MIVVVCPGCHRRLQLADSAGGHEGHCAHCGKHVRLGGAPVNPGMDTNETASNRSPETGSSPAVPVQPAAAGYETRPAAAPRLAAPGYEFLAPPQQPDEIGRLGEFRVLQLLGQGAMGMVFRAEDPGLTRILALKVMLPTVASVPENRERFLREARATALVNHPNVIPIYKIGEDHGVPYLAMPLLKGELLETRLSRERRLPVGDAVRIAREIASGLAAAHERNLIHRDIKPANLWLEPVQRRSASERVKILDFGLARFGDAGLTAPGAVLGTPAYMAPEQAMGQPVDHRCDLFSLGSVMYRMLTGERAFQANEVFAVLMALTTVQPPPPHEVNPEIPVGLSQLVMHLLAKDPAHRPQSASEVVDALSRLGLTRGISSTDKIPVYGSGSSGSIPVVSPSALAAGVSQETLEQPRPRGPGTASNRAFLIVACALILLLVGLLALRALLTSGAASVGTVKLEMVPADSRVVVDDRAPVQLDASNPVLSLPPGKHEVKVLHEGYHGQTLWLEVSTGDNAPVTVELKRLPVVERVPRAPPPVVNPVKPESTSAEQPKIRPTRRQEQNTPDLSGQPKPAADKAEAPRIPPEKPPQPAEAKKSNPDSGTAKLPPMPDGGQKASLQKPNPPPKGTPPETAAVKETKPPPRGVDRQAALWVLESGGFVSLKLPRRATGDIVRNRSELPRGPFDVIAVGLAKNAKVDDGSLAALEGLRQLSILDLSGTAITDAAIPRLRSLRSLTTLLLHDTGITDGAVPDLKLLDTLKALDLQNTKISAAGVQELQAALPRCDITPP